MYNNEEKNKKNSFLYEYLHRDYFKHLLKECPIVDWNPENKIGMDALNYWFIHEKKSSEQLTQSKIPPSQLTLKKKYYNCNIW